MKTITYFLIPLIILSLFAPTFAGMQDSKHTILVQPSDKALSSASLSESAEVISRRLKDISTAKFDVSILENKKQISVTLYDKWDLPTVNKLLEHRGIIEFYETFDKNDLTRLLKGDDRLFTLLTKKTPDNSGAIIGCTSDTGLIRLNNYLNSLGLNKQVKFAWTQDFSKSNTCLYALKLTGGDSPVITYGDIKSVKYDRDRIQITLKPDAAVKFAEATKRSLNRVIALVLDGYVISAPKVMSEITQGEIEISGNFTKEEAGYVAAIINGGVLPTGFNIVR